jgi:magnesium-transporting ATPase (P-type)
LADSAILLLHIRLHAFYRVLRGGSQVEIPNANIVPGDVVVLKPGVLPCDMVILKAERMVVDESALTGEAHPVIKSAIDPTMADVVYDPNRHKSCTLSAGTTISEVGDEEGKDLGLVIATGSFTAKGMLVTDVLSYQRHKFKFDDEVLIVLLILAAEAVILVGLVFVFIAGEYWVYAWFYGMFRGCFFPFKDSRSSNTLQCCFRVMLFDSHLCTWNSVATIATHGLCCIGWNFVSAPYLQTDYVFLPGRNLDCRQS